MDHFKSGFKTTEKNLVIYVPIENEIIMKLKLWMAEMFGNKYTHPPHLTLLILPFDTKNADYKKFDKDITEYFKNKSVIHAISKGVTKDSFREFFKLGFEGAELINIHNELLKIGQNYRNGIFRDKDVVKYFDNFFKPAEWESTLKYGFHRAGEFYEPHITLGEVENYSGWTKEMIQNELERNLGVNANLNLELKEVHVIVAKEDGVGMEFERVISLPYS